jgi:hypothetical protein
MCVHTGSREVCLSVCLSVCLAVWLSVWLAGWLAGLLCSPALWHWATPAAADDPSPARYDVACAGTASLPTQFLSGSPYPGALTQVLHGIKDTQYHRHGGQISQDPSDSHSDSPSCSARRSAGIHGDPRTNLVYAMDLGNDKVVQYSLDTATGLLSLLSEVGTVFRRHAPPVTAPQSDSADSCRLTSCTTTAVLHDV